MELWKRNHNFTNIGANPHTDFNSIGFSVLLKDLMGKNKGYITAFEEEGYIKPPSDEGASLFTEIEKKGGRLIYKYLGDKMLDCIYLFEYGIVTLNFNGHNNYVTAKGMSQEEEQMAELRKFFSEQFLPHVQHGHIFAIVRYGQNINLSSIGDASVPLERGNYTKSVMEAYDAVIRDLK